MKFTSAIIFLSLSACISPTFARGKKMKGKGKADEIPSSLCDSDIQCGQTFTGEVKLTEDLDCPETTSEDCAITLEGKDAVLDCSKYMIHGDSSGGRGICIRNGATAINCHAQQFQTGIYVENGGEVNDCKVMYNDYEGIRIVIEASSTSKMKISNTYTHDNGRDGISFFGSGRITSETSIEVNNVKSNHNGGFGMRFDVLDISSATLKVQIKDSETSKNGESGIFIDGSQDQAIDLELELDGIISRYNQGSGVLLNGNANMKVNVKGDVNLYKNGLGILVFGAAVVLERRGALNSCDNAGTDIHNIGGATFSGNGYTCDSTSPNLSNIITCDPCPNCPQ